QREERLRDVEGDVANSLFFKRQEFLACLTGEVSEAASHFEDDTRFGGEPAQLPQLSHEKAAVGRAVECVVRLPKGMGNSGFDQVEVPVVFITVSQFMMMKVFKMRFSLEPVLPRPALSDLLEEQIPLGLVTVAAWGFCPVIT